MSCGNLGAGIFVCLGTGEVEIEVEVEVQCCLSACLSVQLITSHHQRVHGGRLVILVSQERDPAIMPSMHWHLQSGPSNRILFCGSMAGREADQAIRGELIRQTPSVRKGRVPDRQHTSS